MNRETRLARRILPHTDLAMWVYRVMLHLLYKASPERGQQRVWEN